MFYSELSDISDCLYEFLRFFYALFIVGHDSFPRINTVKLRPHSYVAWSDLISRRNLACSAGLALLLGRTGVLCTLVHCSFTSFA